MKKIFIFTMLSVFLLSSCTRIDAGQVGIKVNLYGSSRGVQDVTEVTGMVAYNPFTTTIYEFPTYMQHIVWSEGKEEGSKENEHFSVTAKGGSNFKMDVGLNFTIDATKVPQIFVKYRKDIETITDTYLRNTVRQVYNDLAASYTPDSLITYRALYEKRAEGFVKDLLEKDGFIVSQCVVIKFTPPESLQASINAKNNSVQLALQADNEVRTAEAKARIAVAEAEGRAKSLKIEADADAYANKVRQQSLTALLVQQQFISAWDGKLPVYGQVPLLFNDIANKK